MKSLLATVLCVLALANAANAFEYQTSASGDSSLMIVVWDVENGTTLVENVQGLSFLKIASDIDGICINAPAADRGKDGLRNPIEFSVAQELQHWHEFVEKSSGDADNYRYTVSAGDDYSDCGTEPEGLYSFGFLTAFKGLAITSNTFEIDDDFSPYDDLNYVDIRDSARKHDEYFGRKGPRGFNEEDYGAPVWDGEAGVAADLSDNRSALYPGDELPSERPYVVEWSGKLRYGKTSDPLPTRYGMRWGPYLGHEWKSVKVGDQVYSSGDGTGRMDDAISYDMSGRVGEPIKFYLFSLGWGAAGSIDEKLASPVHAIQFAHYFNLDSTGCLSYNSTSCVKR